MTDHPPVFRLDAHAAGDEDQRVAAHLASCEECAAYVASATEAASEFRRREGAAADAFVAGLASRRAPPRGLLVRLPRAAWVVAPLLAAAALLLIVRGRPGDPGVADPILVAPGPSIRFKGKKLQLAVVRDRQGDQSRVATEITVRPDDRLRVEVGVDDARPIEVGFLGKDGTWVLLLAPAVLEAGTHLSERSARFDDTPTEGWIVAGDPDDVARAKTTRAFDDVSVIPVVVEP